MSEVKLGIGIITYNRVESLTKTINEIFKNTSCPFDFIVADDGSTDETLEYLANSEVNYISGKNKGISWNRNRAIWYLKNERKCQQIIIFEDDCFPNAFGWEQEWISAINRYGHINYMPDVTLELDNDVSSGEGTAANPFIAPMHQAFCVGYHANALDYVGYLDTRFVKYGEEHVEHTHRFLRAGYGGLLQKHTPERGQLYFLKGGLDVTPSTSHGNHDIAMLNQRIHESIKYDQIYRSPWTSDDEMFEFRSEIDRYHQTNSVIDQKKRYDCVVYLGSDKTYLESIKNIANCEIIELFQGIVVPNANLERSIRSEFAGFFQSDCPYSYHDAIRCRDTLCIYTDFKKLNSNNIVYVEDYKKDESNLLALFNKRVAQLKSLSEQRKKILFVRDWNDTIHFEGIHRPENSAHPNYASIKNSIEEVFNLQDFDILYTNFGYISDEMKKESLLFLNCIESKFSTESEKIISYMRLISQVI